MRKIVIKYTLFLLSIVLVATNLPAPENVSPSVESENVSAQPAVQAQDVAKSDLPVAQAESAPAQGITGRISRGWQSLQQKIKNIRPDSATKEITDGITTRLRKISSAATPNDRSIALSNIQSYIKNSAIKFIENKNKGRFTQESELLQYAIEFVTNSLYPPIDRLINTNFNIE